MTRYFEIDEDYLWTVVRYMHSQEESHFKEWMSETHFKDKEDFTEQIQKHVFYSVHMIYLTIQDESEEEQKQIDEWWEEWKEEHDQEE